MVEFSNREELEAWLRTQPREAAVTLAARAAARVLPALAKEPRTDERRFAVLTLSVLRATALARGAAKYPHSASDLIAAAAAYAAAYAAYAAADAAAYAAYAAADAAAYAAADADAYAADAAADAAAASAYAAATDAAAYATDAAAAYAAYAAADAAAHRDICAALWPDDPATHTVLPGVDKALPEVFADLWRDLKAALLARTDENWSVWTDWYDAWLDGREQFPQLSAKAREDLDIAICLIPDADWEKGPAHVNAIIRGMIEDAVGPAERVAARFQVEHGVVDYKPSRETPADREKRFHDQALAAARALVSKFADDTNSEICIAARTVVDLLESPTWAEPDALRFASRPILSEALIPTVSSSDSRGIPFSVRC